MATLLSTFEALTISVKLLLLFVLVHNALVVQCISERELESMLFALRSKGYSLFGNAIAASDLRYDILAGTSFTFFAPPDNALFVLDLKSTSIEYVYTLSYHIVPRRLFFSDLRRLLNSDESPSLSTLLADHRIRIAAVRKRLPGSYGITANGVDVVVPGLFYDRHVAIHGLKGILDRRLDFGTSNGVLPLDITFPPRMNGADDAAYNSNSSVSSGPAFALPPGFQDLSQLSQVPQPPAIGSPDFLFPVYGSPTPKGYNSPSPEVYVPHGYDSPSPNVEAPQGYHSLSTAIEAPQGYHSPSTAFEVPQGYHSPSPAVEAPVLQAPENGLPEVPSPSDEVPAKLSYYDGNARRKRLELIAEETVPTGHFPLTSWFSGDV